MKKLLLLNLMVVFCAILISNNTFAQANNGNTAVVDTMIFKANAYVIQPNDKLDDLLKKMLSVTVGNGGAIYVRGELVKRLFVDGEEFYSDSPGTAARLLRADKVELVKIYWRLPDQDSFTGIDNRVRQQVINVIMKK